MSVPLAAGRTYPATETKKATPTCRAPTEPISDWSSLWSEARAEVKDAAQVGSDGSDNFKPFSDARPDHPAAALGDPEQMDAFVKLLEAFHLRSRNIQWQRIDVYQHMKEKGASSAEIFHALKEFDKAQSTD